VCPTIQLFVLQVTWTKGSNPLPLTSCINILKCVVGHSPKIEWFQTWHSAIRIMQHFKRLDNQNLSYKSPQCLLIMGYCQMLPWRYNPIDKPSHPTRHTVTPKNTSIFSNIAIRPSHLPIVLLWMLAVACHIQTHPAVACHIQTHPAVACHIQTHSAAARHIQTHPAAAHHIQTHPAVARHIQIHPAVARHIQTQHVLTH